MLCCLWGVQLIINDIYPGSSTHSKVVFKEVLHPIELEFGNADFWGEGKTGRKPLGAEWRTNNQHNLLMATSPKSNPAHIAGRWVQSPWCHHCSPRSLDKKTRHTQIFSSGNTEKCWTEDCMIVFYWILICFLLQ